MMDNSVDEGFKDTLWKTNLVDDGHVEVIELRISPEDMPQFLLT